MIIKITSIIHSLMSPPSQPELWAMTFPLIFILMSLDFWSLIPESAALIKKKDRVMSAGKTGNRFLEVLMQ